MGVNTDQESAALCRLKAPGAIGRRACQPGTKPDPKPTLRNFT
jgi:hypothetical protein